MNSGSSPRVGKGYDARKFHGMIIREIESILLEKRRYDVDFPSSAKSLTSSEIWEIARNKVMQELCVPDSFLQDRDHDALRETYRA
jgi:hypothetical protein